MNILFLVVEVSVQSVYCCVPFTRCVVRNLDVACELSEVTLF